ncbi:MAG: Sec-independent protein translocase protein TatB [Rhizobiaceae bacterium]
MFDIGWPELMVVAIVLVVVVGPKDLPRMLRTFGRTTSKLRSMAGDFRKQFDEALKEAELDEVKDLVADARKLDPTAEIRKQLDPMKKAGDQIRAGLDAAMKPSPAASGTPKPADGAAGKTPVATDKPAPAADKTPARRAASKSAPAKSTAPAKKATPAKKTGAARKAAARAASGKPTGTAS